MPFVGSCHKWLEGREFKVSGNFLDRNNVILPAGVSKISCPVLRITDVRENGAFIDLVGTGRYFIGVNAIDELLLNEEERDISPDIPVA